MQIHIIQNRLLKTFFFLFCGALLGLFILKYTGSDSKWIVSISFALFIIFLSFFVKDPARFFLVLLLLSLPIVTKKHFGRIVDYHYGGPCSFYFTFYDLTIFLLYGLWIPRALLSKRKPGLSRLDLCFFGLIIMAFLSLFNAQDIWLSLYMIFRLFIMFMIFYYLENNHELKSNLKFIILSLLCGLVLESLLGFSQHFFGGLLGLHHFGETENMISFRSLSRIGGTLGHPNNLAKYLLLLIPLPISLLLFAPIKKTHKIFCFGIVVLSLLTLILTLSRAAWLAFFLSFFILLFLGTKARFINFSKLLLIMVSCLILMTSIIFVFHEAIAIRIFSDDIGSARSRIPQMKIALNIISQHPFIGIGANNYSEVMHLYDNTAERITRRYKNVVHNSYMLFASETGLLTLVFLFLFILFLFMHVMRGINDQNKLITAVKIGFFTGQCSFLIQTIVMPTDLVGTPFLIFWSFSGIIVALSRSDMQPQLKESL